MGDHHNHNNHRHSSDNHQRPHSNQHSYQNQNNQNRNRPQQHQNNSHRKPPPHMVAQYQRTDMPGPEKPSRFTQIKQRFHNRFSEKEPTREQIEKLKIKAEHARYDADVKVHQARKAKAERENPTGWRRLVAATMQQQPQRTGRAGTRRPRAPRYYGGRGRGPPQMGDSMLIGPGSFSGDSLMFSPEGGHVGDNMLAFQSNGRGYENDMLSFSGKSTAFNSREKTARRVKSEDSSFGSGAMSMFKF